MNVLHITLSFARGGRREAIAGLCRGLAEVGVANHLCCLQSFDSSANVRAEIFVDSFELNRRHLLDRTALQRLRHYCDTHAIDVVHAHDAASEAAGVLALRRGHPAMLMTFHRTRNFESARLRDRVRNGLAGLRVGAVVTASEERKRHYLATNWVRASKVVCIPIGVDLARFRPDARWRASRRTELGVAAETKLVGVVGHFGSEKGIDLAIKAFQRFRERHLDHPAALVVLGSGSPGQDRTLRSLVDTKHAPHIHFVGFQEAPEQWFPAFDVLLHGARQEAFGLVLAEAMACGVPVVATRVGGIPEVVEDGCSAQLAAAPDEDELEDALRRAMTDPGWLMRASVAASARARERFDRRLYSRRYLDLYARLVVANPGA